MAKPLDDLAFHLVNLAPNQQLDSRKLGHMLWRAEVLHYRRYGVTLSGIHAYQRAPDGPRPYRYFEALARLRDNGRVQLEIKGRSCVNVIAVPIPIAALPGLSEHEWKTISDTLESLLPLSIEEVRAKVCDVLWEQVSDGAAMSVRAAAAIPERITDDIVAWARSTWAQEQRGKTLDAAPSIPILGLQRSAS